MTTEQIEMATRVNQYGTHGYSEASLRSMVNSILCYGGRVTEKERAELLGHTKDYYRGLTPEEASSIIDDQVVFFKEHAKVISDVYIDSEGCSYNSIHWN